MENRAVFLDRDGVITELDAYEKDKPQFIIKKEDIRFIRGAIESIQLLNKNNFKVVIISNQPQIARGLATEQQIREINQIIIEHFRKYGAIIDEIYYCPHHPNLGNSQYTQECSCRKPKSGMILQAADKFSIDLKESWMVGDRISDIKAGHDAGCKTIGVRTGYACADEFTDAQPDIMVNDIKEAVLYILQNIK